MVDVGAKAETRRVAVAEAVVRMQPSTLARIVEGTLPKGDVLATARIAGIMAAKRTSELIPMCHPLNLTAVDIAFQLVDGEPERDPEVARRAPQPADAHPRNALLAAPLISLAPGADRLRPPSGNWANTPRNRSRDSPRAGSRLEPMAEMTGVREPKMRVFFNSIPPALGPGAPFRLRRGDATDIVVHGIDLWMRAT